MISLPISMIFMIQKKKERVKNAERLWKAIQNL